MSERSIGIGAVLLAAMSSCHRGPDPSSTTTTTSARVIGGDEAVARLTKARCDREMTCDKVGHGKTFEDRDACMRDLRGRTDTELLSRVCARGISEHHLEYCLSEVRRESCGNPLHTAERIDDCAGRMLCVDERSH